MEGNLNALTTIFTETYYWITVVMMFLIHVGFCTYEVGVSRRRNHLKTLMKNAMAIPLVTVTFFLFGWYIYFAFPNGPGITGGLLGANWAEPWNPLMGAHLGGVNAGESNVSPADAAFWHRLNGVFWAAFLLFSITTASIVSGAIIERARSGAFWIIAVLLGSFLWILDAAWGWHPLGWMVQLWGYHDAYASGVVHAIAGGSALATLIVLGPRIGKFRPDGTPRDIPPHNVWLVTIGLFLIYTGFWGFYAACNIPIISPEGIKATLPNSGITGAMWTATNIYLAPTSLSAITFNFLMSLSGGMMAGYIFSKGDPFWTFSAGLCGVISASAGNDLYHPIQAMLIGAIVPYICYKLHYWVERRFKIDDAVGACAVHGYGGFLGVVVAGFMLWGQPSSPDPNFAHINPLGNFLGAVLMFALGFFPTYIVAKILNSMNLLRVPLKVELEGVDFAINHAFEASVREVGTAEKAMIK
jgi:ammonia channel protein AmtB